MEPSDSRLNFIIVGASIAGLASAIALKRSGHNVLVLDRHVQIGEGSTMPVGCVRVSPNGSKILYDWGLEPELTRIATISEGFAVFRYEGNQCERDLMGLHRYNKELLTEARGNFLTCRHRDLARVLHDEAVRQATINDAQDTLSPPPRVEIRFGAEVARIDQSDSGPSTSTPTVVLSSGERLSADAIIGADGVHGLVRKTLMEEEGVGSVWKDLQSGGHTVYSSVVSKSLLKDHPDLAPFWEHRHAAFFGNNRGAMTFVGGKEDDLSFAILTPDEPKPAGACLYGAKPTILGEDCDPGIRKLASLAPPPVRVRIQEPETVESWVSRSGRILVLGEAAHPFPPTSVHTYSVALEDGAFIGKIFSHTSDRTRVPEFLYAFQEHREPRCARIRAIELKYIWGLTYPDGELQVMRDAMMRANAAAGRNVLDNPESVEGQVMDETVMVFSYDPADDADEWWMAWGRFHNTVNTQAPGDSDAESVEEDYDAGTHRRWASFSGIACE